MLSSFQGRQEADVDYLKHCGWCNDGEQVWCVGQVTRGENGRLYNKVLNTLQVPSLLDEQIALARKNLPKQGWLNPYLVA